MARKIENQMVEAIRAGRSWRNDNTEVRQADDGVCRVYLFGNQIAEIGGRNGTFWTLAGWNTSTTRSRINALARAFNWRGVRNVLGAPFVHGSAVAPFRAISADEWIDALV